MGLIASLFSGLKAEVEWLIASLAVAPAAGDVQAASDTPQADAKAGGHDSDSGSGRDGAILTDQQADNSGHSAAQHGSSDDTPPTGSDAQDAGIAAAHSPAPLLFVDFIAETGANPDPLPVLSPLSTDATVPGPEAAWASDTPLASHGNADLHPSAPAGGWAVTLPNPGAGDFMLASLNPVLQGGFSNGHGGGGGGGSGTPIPSYTSGAGGTFEITLNFDSSVSKAPAADANGFGFVADMKAVADFFTSHFTSPNGTKANPIDITINVGFGEVAGSNIGNSALGESQTYYVKVPTTFGGHTYSSEYASLQAAYANVFGTKNPDVSLPASDPVSGSQAWWVTTAEGKALGMYSGTGVDGYIGLSGSSGTFSYNPGSVATGTYDFESVVAHEISEVMGRATLNGAKYFAPKTPEYSPLDLFHFSGDNTPIFSGTTAGYFSIDSGATDLKDFNTSAAGDYSDWADSTPPDSFDWSGGLSATAPVTWEDYFAMEAVGWLGVSNVSSTTGSGWTNFG